MSSDMQVFKLPDLGEGLTEAELVNWLVAVGDEIVVDQPIAEVETAKSMVEVPSPYAGTVAELHGEAGQTLDVGKPLISIARAGSSAASPAADPVPAPAGSVDPSPVSSGLDVSSAVEAAAETYRTEEKAGSAQRADWVRYARGSDQWPDASAEGECRRRCFSLFPWLSPLLSLPLSR